MHTHTQTHTIKYMLYKKISDWNSHLLFISLKVVFTLKYKGIMGRGHHQHLFSPQSSFKILTLVLGPLKIIKWCFILKYSFHYFSKSFPPSELMSFPYKTWLGENVLWKDGSPGPLSD